jgi:hypothetical protein
MSCKNLTSEPRHSGSFILEALMLVFPLGSVLVRTLFSTKTYSHASPDLDSCPCPHFSRTPVCPGPRRCSRAANCRSSSVAKSPRGALPPPPSRSTPRQTTLPEGCPSRARWLRQFPRASPGRRPNGTSCPERRPRLASCPRQRPRRLFCRGKRRRRVFCRGLGELRRGANHPSRL